MTMLLRETEPEDLIKFGLIPEFVGRLPVVATLDELDETALIQILVEPKNALLKQYQKMFRMEGVELEIREPALRAIARKALARKTGARGLRSILEQVLLDVMYDLPSLSNLARVVVDESTIANDGKPLLMFADTPKVASAQCRLPSRRLGGRCLSGQPSPRRDNCANWNVGFRRRSIRANPGQACRGAWPCCRREFPRSRRCPSSHGRVRSSGEPA